MIVSISTPQSCTTQCDLLQLCEVALRKQEQQQGESFMLLFFVVIKSSVKTEKLKVENRYAQK